MVDLTGIDLYNGVLPSHMKKDIWEDVCPRHLELAESS